MTTQPGDSHSSSLETDKDKVPPQVLHQSIPEGLKLKNVPYGYGLFATKYFPKGSTVYTGRQYVIPNKYAKFKLIIDNSDGAEYLLDTETHSVEVSESKRWLYLFDSFMNHSCDPSTISRSHPDTLTSGTYDTVALRDIHPGDEITCDYNLFEYDCHGKEIERCLCGAKNCIGRVAGFKFLSTPDQLARMQLVDIAVLEAMSADIHNKFFYASIDESALCLSVDDSDAWRLCAKRDLEKGFSICSFVSRELGPDTLAVIEFRGIRLVIPKVCNCRSPNSSETIDQAECKYSLATLADIGQGQRVTSDVLTLCCS